MFVRGALGKGGRKRARRATRFLSGDGGFLTASAVMAAVGVAWGLYDNLQQQRAGGAGGAAAPPMPGPGGSAVPMPSLLSRLVRVAASAANADGTLTEPEHRAILARAREAGVEAPTGDALLQRQPLADIVAGVSSDAERRDLYVLAFSIVRADEDVSGAERIYLAQLAHALGLDATAVAALERDTAAAIDAAGPAPA